MVRTVRDILKELKIPFALGEFWALDVEVKLVINLGLSTGDDTPYIPDITEIKTAGGCYFFYSGKMISFVYDSDTKYLYIAATDDELLDNDKFEVTPEYIFIKRDKITVKIKRETGSVSCLAE